MSRVYHYETVFKALAILKEKGFIYDYNLHDRDIVKHPENYKIIHIYRYEGDSSPDEEATVYAIQSKSGKKGVFVTGFAASSTDEATNALTNIAIRKNC
jgi:hypothetical protein